MDLAEVLRFLEGEKFGVLATAAEDGKPELEEVFVTAFSPSVSAADPSRLSSRLRQG